MIYKIKKGNHRSSWFPKFTFDKKILGSFKFLGDFSYSIDTQEDSNKLIGLSDGWNHHKNSIRLGWRWNDGIELTTITYVNGKRDIKPLCFIESEKKYLFYISIEKSIYYVTVMSSENNDTWTEIVWRDSKWNFLRVVLKPFFGGKNKAPKDFKIEIN